MRDNSYQLRETASGYYLNNADGLRRAASGEEIKAAREKLESRFPPQTADSSDPRELTPTQSREQQQQLALNPIKTEKLHIPYRQEPPRVYYQKLLLMIDELRTAQQGLEKYSESDHKDKQSPSSFHERINKLITPYPLQDFISNNANIKATESDLAKSYLDKEKEVLAKLLGYKDTDPKSNSGEGGKEYLIYQARIANTLKTIDKSELNLRLSFINLYLQASLKQIKPEKDPIVKEALFAKTVKFLNTNLISDSLPSKERADDYIKQLRPVINLINNINDAVPELTISDENGDSILLSSPILALKTSLVNNLEEHYEKLIGSDNLSVSHRINLFKNNDLISILSPILSPQQRIEKTLNTTNKTDINFKLALINLYLENSVEEIRKGDDKETRVNKFQDTIEFLDHYLLTLAPLKSEEQASEHVGILGSTLTPLKELKNLFPESDYPEYLNENHTQRSPSFALKNYLADIVTKQAEKIIETSHLGLISKSAFVNNQDINDIAGERTTNKLNNHLLEYLLKQKNFSINSRLGNILFPQETNLDLNREYSLLAGKTHEATYDKDLLKTLLIQDLGKSITDNSLFFKFLKLMIENTPEPFQKFQNDTIPPSLKEDFKDFKTSVLKYLNSPLSRAAGAEDASSMTLSLQALMLFKDPEIKRASKAFYLRVLQETKSDITLETMLKELKIYQNSSERRMGKSLPISLEDLNNSLKVSPVIKAIGLKQLEKELGLTSLENDKVGKLVFSEHEVNLTETETNIVQGLKQLGVNLLAPKQPPEPSASP